MNNYRVKLKDSRGEITTEVVRGENEIAVKSDMRSRGSSVLEIEKRGGFADNFNKVGKKDLSEFFEQLSYIVGSGLNLHRGIKLISGHLNNKKLRTALDDIVIDVEQGSSLSKAFEKYPEIFSDLIVYQVRSGEEGGFIEETLNQLSGSLLSEADFNKKFKGAMRYPFIILGVTAVILYFMLTMIVPQLSETLLSFDAELPQITLIIIAVSDFLQAYWYLFILGAGGIYGGYTFFVRERENRRKVDALMIKMPILKRMIISVNVTRISRTLASLMKGGVEMEKTLTNVVKITENVLFQDALIQVTEDVTKRGMPLSKAFEETGLFPETFVQLLSVGEETGDLDGKLESLAERWHKETVEALDGVIAIINPILMVFIGVVVGTVVVSMFLPMFSLMDNL